MRGDGDGWSVSPGGIRHWGRFGAAGLLLRAPAPDGAVAVLLQHRAPWSHQGGTWALPGGALDSHETPAKAAVREAWEEAGIHPSAVRVRGERVTAAAPSGWIYTTVVADTVTTLPTSRNRESTELAWVPEDEVADRPLHPGFAASWPGLRAARARIRLDGLDDPEPLAAVLPRVVDLDDQGFVWVQGESDGAGADARIVDSDTTADDTTVGADSPREPFITVTRAQLLD